MSTWTDRLFGFKFLRNEPKQKNIMLVAPAQDGATIESSMDGAASGYFSQAYDLESAFKDEGELINRYRALSLYSEVDSGIQDIVNETISEDEVGNIVMLDLSRADEDLPASIQEKMDREFQKIVDILQFQNSGADLFRQFYVEGRLSFQIVIDSNKPQDGIQDLIPFDATTIKKIVEIEKEKHPETGVDVIVNTKSFFIFKDSDSQDSGVRMSEDTVIHITSGLRDATTNFTLSHLHKAIRPANQLRMLEDANIIYFLSRAPERRIFYIDVGSLPKHKADEYVRGIMQNYRNKQVYDAKTGELKDAKQFLSMMEDFWMPRREGCFSLDTKIELLDGRSVELGQLIVEHKLGVQNWVYSVSNTGEIVPGKISWAGVTRTDTQVVDIHLDNGETITCTPDHKFILRNGEKVEAKDLQAGSSLMPFNTDKKPLQKSRDHHRTYTHVQCNATNEWKVVHRLISEYFNGQQGKNVIHHVDFDRYNNNPDNLLLMEKVEHLKLHSGAGQTSWLVGDVELHKQRLSESGKKFFITPEGIERRKQISSHNQTCKEVWDGARNGREKIKQLRENDRADLSPEEYIAKWSPGLHLLNVRNQSLYKRRFDYDFSSICEIINAGFHRKLSFGDAVGLCKGVYPDMTKTLLKSILRTNGYNTYQEYMSRTFGDGFKWHKKDLIGIHNHKVVSVVFRDDLHDVGTLTIDEHHEHHDFHNFALSSGVFVMNSKGTEITTLPGGTGLAAQLESINFFRQKLLASLNIPMTRMEPGNQFSVGRATEISRDEVKFAKFIESLRRSFSRLFIDALRVQCLLRGIMTVEDWDSIENKILVIFAKDNHFSELKELDVLATRIDILDKIEPYIGKHFSREYVDSHILGLTTTEREEMQKQIRKEKAEAKSKGEDEPVDDGMGGGGGGGFGSDIGGAGMGGNDFGSEPPAGGNPLEMNPSDAGLPEIEPPMNAPQFGTDGESSPEGEM